jgi:hypothetical protein
MSFLKNSMVHGQKFFGLPIKCTEFREIFANSVQHMEYTEEKKVRNNVSTEFGKQPRSCGSGIGIPDLETSEKVLFRTEPGY